MSLEKQLLELLKDNSKAFHARLSEVKCKFDVGDIKLSGKFFYLNFKDSQPSINDFVEFIYGQIIDFCIPYRERIEILKKIEETHDSKYALELSDKAKRLFIRAKKQQYSSGEPGELILFILLETILNAPQIVSKMYLKTSVNMPVHGADAIHVAYNNDAGMLCLYWGESKLHKQISSALSDTCVSIENFITGKETGPPRERDLQIIRDHISIADGEMKKALLKYLDPYEPESNKVEECFACFVGFEYEVLSKLNELDQVHLVQHFEEKYSEKIKSAVKMFTDKICENNIQHLRFVFFLLPFRDLDELRSKFFRKLGVMG